jgi:hypothetical protein
MASNNHDFSPITNDSRLSEALEYIAKNSLDLARTVLQRELSIDTICFFTHSPEEYAYLLSAVQVHGQESRFSHGPTTYVDTDLKVADQQIKILGVRQPDPSRPWVGYGDYPITDEEYVSIKSSNSQYVQEISSGRGQPLLELKHPDFDVVGYLVQQEDHVNS